MRLNFTTSCAETLRCRRIGTAGVVVLAKRRGLLTSLRDAFAKLSGSGLWLSKELVEELCIMEGE